MPPGKRPALANPLFPALYSAVPTPVKYILITLADVYERLTPPGKRPTFRTVVATQTVSGIWHGLFPGYWLFFVSTAFMLEASKVLYR
jgi:hypothetical protein